MTTSQGSPAFQPPEVAAGNDKFSGMKVDIWATGVTLFNMISGKFPFDGDSIYNLFENIAKGVYTVPEEADTLLADLISKILEKDPAQRLTLEKIEGHNWLKAELPRSQDEIKVIPVLDTPMSQVSQGQLKEELLLAEEQKAASEVALTNISNPNFSYDTTLIPFLENMFEDLTNNLRRSSAVEEGYFEARKKKNNRTFRKGVIAERFLKRLSKTPSSTETSDNTLKVEVNIQSTLLTFLETKKQAFKLIVSRPEINKIAGLNYCQFSLFQIRL
jgi:serine/threonine protein kinase